MRPGIRLGITCVSELELTDVNVEMFFRNCIVCRGCTVKVSDLGSGRSAYAADYFRIEGRPPLPIRWMAWESMLMVSARWRHGCLFHAYTYLNDTLSFLQLFPSVLLFRSEQSKDLTRCNRLSMAAFPKRMRKFPISTDVRGCYWR
jgi:hypothetical protein